VIVDNLDVESVPVLPLETDTPLLVDPYAVLSLPIAHQPFKLIRRRNHEVAQVSGGVEVFQLLTRSLLYPSVEPLHKLTPEIPAGCPCS
jgi:hypothetical protein